MPYTEAKDGIVRVTMKIKLDIAYSIKSMHEYQYRLGRRPLVTQDYSSGRCKIERLSTLELQPELDPPKISDRLTSVTAVVSNVQNCVSQPVNHHGGTKKL
jgi:hypothetical protein